MEKKYEKQEFYLQTTGCACKIEGETGKRVSRRTGEKLRTSKIIENV